MSERMRVPKAADTGVEKPNRAAPRSRRGVRTREAVLRAAVVVFGREGVRQTSILTIAQEAGVASGTVYQYFADKEDIFRCLLAELDERLVALAGSDDAGRFRVREAIARYLAVVRDNVPVFRAWWDLLQPPTEFSDSWLTLHRRFVGEIADVVRERDDARDANLDPEIVGELFAMYLERSGYTRFVMHWDEELTDEDVVTLGSRLFGEGLMSSPDA